MWNLFDLERLLTLSVLLPYSFSLILPMQNPSGTPDIASIISHVTLMEQTITSLQTEMQTIKQKEENDKTVLQTAQNGILTLKSDLRITNSELTTVKGKLQTAEYELDQAKKDIELLRSDLKTSDTNLAIIKHDFTKIPSPAEFTDLKTEVESLKVSSATLQQINSSVIDIMSQDVKSNTKVIQSLSTQLKSVVDSVIQTDRNLNSTQEEVTNLLPQISETVTNLTEATQDIKDNDHQIQDLDRQINDCKTSFYAVSSHMQNMDSEISELNKKLSEVVQNQTSSYQDLSSTIASVQSTAAGLTSVQTQCTSLNNSLTQLRGEVEIYRNETAECMTQYCATTPITEAFTPLTTTVATTSTITTAVLPTTVLAPKTTVLPKLISTTVPVMTTEEPKCEDSPLYDCAELDLVAQICGEKSHSTRLYCPKYCGLCGPNAKPSAPVITTQGPKCQDSRLDCAELDREAHICREDSEATRLYCPRYCGLCGPNAKPSGAQTTSSATITTMSTCTDSPEVNCTEFELTARLCEMDPGAASLYCPRTCNVPCSQ